MNVNYVKKKMLKWKTILSNLFNSSDEQTIKGTPNTKRIIEKSEWKWKENKTQSFTLHSEWSTCSVWCPIVIVCPWAHGILVIMWLSIFVCLFSSYALCLQWTLIPRAQLISRMVFLERKKNDHEQRAFKTDFIEWNSASSNQKKARNEFETWSAYVKAQNLIR